MAVLVAGNFAGFDPRFGCVIHLASVRIFGPAGEDVESAIPVSPLNHRNLGRTGPPAAHAAQVGVIDVDGVGSNKSRTIVVDDVSVRQSLNLELSTNWVAGPIGSRTANGTILEIGSDGILTPWRSHLVLRVGISSGANDTTSDAVRVCRHAVLVFLEALRLFSD